METDTLALPSVETAHGPASYVKIWALLVVLFGVSLVGSMVGMLWLTLVSAFGIAVVKAMIVTAYFMHLDRERAYIKYLLLVVVALLLVLFIGLAPDVMKAAGTNWENAGPVSRPPAPARH